MTQIKALLLKTILITGCLFNGILAIWLTVFFDHLIMDKWPAFAGFVGIPFIAALIYYVWLILVIKDIIVEDFNSGQRPQADQSEDFNDARR